jgi:hypothetical protein
LKKLGSFAVLAMAISPAFAETWAGNLVDAMCTMSDEGRDCAATPATHLFAIELSDSKLLTLNAAGNEKAADAVKNVKTANPRAIVTGSLDGLMVKVETIEIQ